MGSQHLSLTTVLFVLFFINFTRYFVIAGSAFWFFWKRKPERFDSVRIQKRQPSSKEIKNEIFYSMCTLFVFLAVATYIYSMQGTPLNKIYFNISDHGWGYFAITTVALLLIHDTYFYWIHRFMHLKAIYPYFHQVHHRSITPTPWAAFSFHPLEAILEALIIPIAVMLFPVHAGAILIFQFSSFFFNVLGHLGHEFAPAWVVHHPVAKFFNTSYHHNLHHQKFKTNFGLYLNVWDRLLGTQDEHYTSGFDAIKAKNTK